LAVDSSGVVEARVVGPGTDEPDPARTAGAAAAAMSAGPVPADVADDGQVRWTLHPDSPIDRVGLEAAIAVANSVEEMEWLEHRLDSAISTEPARRPASPAPAADLSSSVAPSDSVAAGADTAGSGAGEVTGRGKDSDGHQPSPGPDADRDGQRDAAERAAAAEAAHAAGAAAARAEVTYTPETAAADPAQPGRPTRAAHRPAHRAPTPHRERSPRR
jgi:hypothetical protein